ncbi:uncharacterized protein [Lolium perenne]|uniref:uncharacterized protein n=1 Tax=Lolium perenne TaxID=4522 RepID=UPI0021F66BD5|nr:uncharacterized protein LOC127307420 [Lolium perenne]XP_051194104.1 uncharacterized protein LOC127307420 [Lolium perenne]XP_051194105.1 uncharacterized protein LOC127307420 [Lolium perenne]XP_051194106.1 uncharacterized protein LOC127307420 [Lolium perenne]
MYPLALLRATTTASRNIPPLGLPLPRDAPGRAPLWPAAMVRLGSCSRVAARCPVGAALATVTASRNFPPPRLYPAARSPCQSSSVAGGDGEARFLLRCSDRRRGAAAPRRSSSPGSGSRTQRLVRFLVCLTVGGLYLGGVALNDALDSPLYVPMSFLGKGPTPPSVHCRRVPGRRSLCIGRVRRRRAVSPRSSRMTNVFTMADNAAAVWAAKFCVPMTVVHAAIDALQLKIALFWVRSLLWATPTLHSSLRPVETERGWADRVCSGQSIEECPCAVRSSLAHANSWCSAAERPDWIGDAQIGGCARRPSGCLAIVIPASSGVCTSWLFEEVLVAVPERYARRHRRARYHGGCHPKISSAILRVDSITGKASIRHYKQEPSCRERQRRAT